MSPKQETKNVCVQEAGSKEGVNWGGGGGALGGRRLQGWQGGGRGEGCDMKLCKTQQYFTLNVLTRPSV